MTPIFRTVSGIGAVERGRPASETKNAIGKR